MDNIKEFIEKYNLVVDSTKSSEKILFIRSSIHNEQEAQLFVKKFGQKTCTIWRVHYGNYNPQRVVFRKAWVCRHSNVRSTGIQDNNCGAKMDILVKKINPYTTKNDTFLLKKPPLPCIIRMHFKHNHNCQEDLKHLKVPDKVKELYYGHFDNGYGVAKAIKLHQENVEKMKDVTSTHFIPTRRQAYYLYEMWRQQSNLTGVPCEDNDVINNESWQVFDWDDLINAIPRETPPVKNSKLPTDSALIHPVNEDCHLNYKTKKTEANIPTTSTEVMLQINNPINKLSSSSPVLPTLYVLEGPVQTQHVANSSNHLNGSVLTVMDSSSMFSIIPPALNNSEVSTTITPQISSVMSLENITSKPTINSVLLLKENLSELSSGLSIQNCISNSERKSISKNFLPQSVYKSETCVSNSLYQPKASDRSNTKLSLERILPYVPENTNVDFKSNTQNCTSEFKILGKKDLVLFRTDRQVPITSQICQPVFKDIIINSMASISQNSVVDSNEIRIQEKSGMSNIQTSLSSVSNEPKVFFSCIQSPLANTLLSTNNKYCESSVPTSTQIQITNTVHQSGAQVSMNSPIQLNRNPIVNALHVSELLATQPSSEEPIKIKEEPPDLPDTDNLEESENSEFMPTIVKVSSLSTAKHLTNEEAMSMKNIKVEKGENDTTGNESSMLCDNLPNSSQVSMEDEEDHQFLMSLLPELKQLPSDLKIKLKSNVQNLIFSAKTIAKKRKRKANEIGV